MIAKKENTSISKHTQHHTLVHIHLQVSVTARYTSIYLFGKLIFT